MPITIPTIPPAGNPEYGGVANTSEAVVAVAVYLDAVVITCTVGAGVFTLPEIQVASEAF